jgi:hypothetical protein
MPILASVDTESFKLPTSNYGYSAVRPDKLGATEYTLVNVVCDKSGSVTGFRAELEKAVKEVVKGCKFSPRADNLLLRVVLFDQGLQEVHGFKPLADCNESDYDNLIPSGGSTALYDTAQNCIEATNNYAAQLAGQDFLVNALTVVLTDGDDNASTYGTKHVAAELTKAVSGEKLESMVSILVGCNTSTTLSSYLQKFKDDVGFTQYVDIGKADAKSLAKLAKFVSKSITSQSQALGTGGPSQSLTF